MGGRDGPGWTKINDKTHKGIVEEGLNFEVERKKRCGREERNSLHNK